MSDQGLGIATLLFMGGGILMAYRSIQTGQSVTPWPMGPVTREGSPGLWWFDLSTYCAIIALGAFAGLKLLS